MKKPAFILCLLCILAFQNLTPSIGQVISAADYGLKEDGDAIPAIREALEACRTGNAKKLLIPKGTYPLYPDRAEEKYIHISNNDDGLKRIAFPLKGMKDFEIDAQGSMFIMHEELDAFYLKVPDECDYEIVANEFIFRGNKILPSKNYPADSETGPVFNFTSSRNILIEKNEYLWEEPAVIQADQ